MEPDTKPALSPAHQALENYRLTVRQKLHALLPVFAKASIGNFSDDVNIPETEDEFTDLFVGVQVMQEVIREKIEQLEILNSELEKKINEKTAALEEAQRLARIGNWEWDMRNEIITWSDEMFELFGMDPGTQKVGFETYFGAVHPQDRSEVQTVIENAITTGAPFCFFHRVQSGNGQVRFLECRGFVVSDETGGPISMYGTAQDVTELKQAEKALRETNARLETRVAERTGRLKKVIEQLEHEIRERKSAQAGQDFLAAIVQSSEDAIIGLKTNGIITSWNTGAGHLFGMSSEQALGKKFTSILPAEKRAAFPDILAQVCAGNTIRAFEISNYGSFESPLHISFSFSPIRDRNSAIIGISAIGEDATLRKQYESDLNNLAHYTEETPYPVLRFSIETMQLLYANQAGRIIATRFIDPLTEKVTPRFEKLFRNVYGHGEVSWHEFDDEDRVFMFTLVPLHASHSINVYGADVTAIRMAEAEIKRLSFVISKTNNAIMIADAQGKIQWVNEGFEQLTGYTLADMKGTSGEVLRRGGETGLHPENRLFRKMLSKTQPVSYESHNYRKDGTEFWVFSTLTPILNERGELESVVVIDSDITLRKKAERELIAARRQAEDSSKAKELFLANMSHEIRTPMNAIMGFIQLLQDTELNERQRGYMRTVNFAGENLIRIINDVLDLAKIESGKFSIEKIGFNMVELLDSLTASMSYPANEKHIRLLMSCAPDIPPEVEGDPVRLNQVLMNLVGNAIKFTEKGHVKLSVSVLEKNENDVRLAFEVEDTGIGIPAEKQEQVFEAFEQGHKEASRMYGGTGLGLSIVRRLTALMGGLIRLDSTPGKGSRFTAELPFPIAQPKSTLIDFRDVSGEQPSLSRKKVLLVEDNVLNQMVAEQFLQLAGMEVAIAGNGREAITLLETMETDIVLMDIQMPEMDGYETARYIRNKLVTAVKTIPILAMTAHAIRGEEEKCLLAGMNDYIAKPLVREVLMDKIRRLLYDDKKERL